MANKFTFGGQTGSGTNTGGQAFGSRKFGATYFGKGGGFGQTPIVNFDDLEGDRRKVYGDSYWSKRDELEKNNPDNLTADEIDNFSKLFAQDQLFTWDNEHRYPDLGEVGGRDQWPSQWKPSINFDDLQGTARNIYGDAYWAKRDELEANNNGILGLGITKLTADQIHKMARQTAEDALKASVYGDPRENLYENALSEQLGRFGLTMDDYNAFPDDMKADLKNTFEVSKQPTQDLFNFLQASPLVQEAMQRNTEVENQREYDQLLKTYNQEKGALPTVGEQYREFGPEYDEESMDIMRQALARLDERNALAEDYYKATGVTEDELRASMGYGQDREDEEVNALFDESNPDNADFIYAMNSIGMTKEEYLAMPKEDRQGLLTAYKNGLEALQDWHNNVRKEYDEQQAPASVEDIMREAVLPYREKRDKLAQLDAMIALLENNMNVGEKAYDPMLAGLAIQGKKWFQNNPALLEDLRNQRDDLLGVSSPEQREANRRAEEHDKLVKKYQEIGQDPAKAEEEAAARTARDKRATAIRLADKEFVQALSSIGVTGDQFRRMQDWPRQQLIDAYNEGPEALRALGEEYGNSGEEMIRLNGGDRQPLTADDVMQEAIDEYNEANRPDERYRVAKEKEALAKEKLDGLNPLDPDYDQLHEQYKKEYEEAVAASKEAYKGTSGYNWQHMPETALHLGEGVFKMMSAGLYSNFESYGAAVRDLTELAHIDDLVKSITKWNAKTFLGVELSDKVLPDNPSAVWTDNPFIDTTKKIENNLKSQAKKLAEEKVIPEVADFIRGFSSTMDEKTATDAARTFVEKVAYSGSENFGHMLPQYAFMIAKGPEYLNSLQSLEGAKGFSRFWKSTVNAIKTPGFTALWADELGRYYMDQKAALGDKMTDWDRALAPLESFWSSVIEFRDTSLGGQMHTRIFGGTKSTIKDFLRTAANETSEENRQLITHDVFEDFGDMLSGRTLRHELDNKDYDDLFYLGKYLDLSVETGLSTTGMTMLTGMTGNAVNRFSGAVEAMRNGTATQEQQDDVLRLALATDMLQEAQEAAEHAPTESDQHAAFAQTVGETAGRQQNDGQLPAAAAETVAAQEAAPAPEAAITPEAEAANREEVIDALRKFGVDELTLQNVRENFGELDPQKIMEMQRAREDQDKRESEEGELAFWAQDPEMLNERLAEIQAENEEIKKQREAEDAELRQIRERQEQEARRQRMMEAEQAQQQRVQKQVEQDQALQAKLRQDEEDRAREEQAARARQEAEAQRLRAQQKEQAIQDQKAAEDEQAAMDMEHRADQAQYDQDEQAKREALEQGQAQDAEELEAEYKKTAALIRDLKTAEDIYWSQLEYAFGPENINKIKDWVNKSWTADESERAELERYKEEVLYPIFDRAYQDGKIGQEDLNRIFNNIYDVQGKIEDKKFELDDIRKEVNKYHQRYQEAQALREEERADQERYARDRADKEAAIERGQEAQALREEERADQERYARDRAVKAATIERTQEAQALREEERADQERYARDRAVKAATIERVQEAQALREEERADQERYAQDEQAKREALERGQEQDAAEYTAAQVQNIVENEGLDTTETTPAEPVDWSVSGLEETEQTPAETQEEKNAPLKKTEDEDIEQRIEDFNEKYKSEKKAYNKLLDERERAMAKLDDAEQKNKGTRTIENLRKRLDEVNGRLEDFRSKNPEFFDEIIGLDNAIEQLQKNSYLSFREKMEAANKLQNQPFAAEEVQNIVDNEGTVSNSKMPANERSVVKDAERQSVPENTAQDQRRANETEPEQGKGRAEKEENEQAAPQNRPVGDHQGPVNTAETPETEEAQETQTPEKQEEEPAPEAEETEENPETSAPEKQEEPEPEAAETEENPETQTPEKQEEPKPETAETEENPETSAPEKQEEPEPEAAETEENPVTQTPEKQEEPVPEAAETEENPETQTPEKQEEPVPETGETEENPETSAPEKQEEPEPEAAEDQGNETEEQKKQNARKIARNYNLNFAEDGRTATRAGVSLHSWSTSGRQTQAAQVSYKRSGRTAAIDIAELQVMDVFAKMHNFAVMMHDTLQDGMANGMYVAQKPGEMLTVHIAQDAENPLRTVFGHELYHAIEQVNPAAAKKMQQAWMDYAQRAGLDVSAMMEQVREDHRRANLPVPSDPNIMGELVANSLYDVIGDQRTMQVLAAQNRGMVQQIRNWVSKVLQDIRSIVSRYADRDAGARMLRDTAGAMENMRRMIDEALDKTEAVDHSKKAVKSLGENGPMTKRYQERMEKAENRRDANRATRQLAQDLLRRMGVEANAENVNKMLNAAQDFAASGGAMSNALRRAGFQGVTMDAEMNRAFGMLAKYMDSIMGRDTKGYMELMKGEPETTQEQQPQKPREPAVRKLKRGDDVKLSLKDMRMLTFEQQMSRAFKQIRDIQQGKKISRSQRSDIYQVHKEGELKKFDIEKEITLTLQTLEKLVKKHQITSEEQMIQIQKSMLRPAAKVEVGDTVVLILQTTDENGDHYIVSMEPNKYDQNVDSLDITSIYPRPKMATLYVHTVGENHEIVPTENVKITKYSKNADELLRKGFAQLQAPQDMLDDVLQNVSHWDNNVKLSLKTFTSDMYSEMQNTDKQLPSDMREIYRRQSEINSELRDVEKKIKDFNGSQEIKDFTRLMQKADTADMDSILAQWKELEERYGIDRLQKRREELKAETEALKNQEEAVRHNQLAQEIQDSGKTEAEFFRDRAVKEFGYTPYFYDAGYILPNGRMLNFSGEKGRHYGTRGQDHRAISTIYDGTLGATESLNAFVNEGNIRIIDEAPGIDVSIGTELTEQQKATIKKHIRSNNKNGYSVDFTDATGKTAGTLEYDAGVNPDQVIRDIERVQSTGNVQERSIVADFHTRWSVKTTAAQDAAYMEAVERGDMETAQEMVDRAAEDAGYTRYGYHGTKMPILRYDTLGYGSETDYENKRLPFTVFKPGQSGGIYLATNREVSQGFARNYRDKHPGTVMSLYAKFENPLIVNEHVWTSVPHYYNIPTPTVMLEAGYQQKELSTEEISHFAQEHGYDGVIIEGIREGADTQTDDIIAFSPKQLKLADPVVYDDQGKVIPLSERFNPENEDIRWSVKDGQSVAQLTRDLTKTRDADVTLQTARALTAKVLEENGAEVNGMTRGQLVSAAMAYTASEDVNQALEGSELNIRLTKQQDVSALRAIGEAANRLMEQDPGAFEALFTEETPEEAKERKKAARAQAKARTAEEVADAWQVRADYAGTDQNAHELIVDLVDAITNIRTKATMDQDGRVVRQTGHWKAAVPTLARAIQQSLGITMSEDTVKRTVREALTNMDEELARGVHPETALDNCLNMTLASLTDLYMAELNKNSDRAQITKDALNLIRDKVGSLVLMPTERSEVEAAAEDGLKGFRKVMSGVVDVRVARVNKETGNAVHTTGQSIEDVYKDEDVVHALGLDPDLVNPGDQIMDLYEKVRALKTPVGRAAITTEETDMLHKVALNLVASYFTSGENTTVATSTAVVSDERHQEVLRQAEQLEKEVSEKQDELMMAQSELSALEEKYNAVVQNSQNLYNTLMQERKANVPAAQLEDLRAQMLEAQQNEAQAQKDLKAAERKLKDLQKKQTERQQKLRNLQKQLRAQEKQNEKQQRQLDRMLGRIDRLNNQILMEKNKVQDARARARAQKARTESMERIRKQGGVLRKMLAQPGKKNGYVQQNYVKPVAEFVQALSENDGRKSAEMGKRLRDMVREAQTSQDYATASLFDQGLSDMVDKSVKVLEEKGALRNLSDQELSLVENTVAGVVTQLKNMNKFLSAVMKEEAQGAAAGAIQVLNRNKRTHTGAVGKVNSLLLQHTNAERLFEQLAHHEDNAISQAGQALKEGYRKAGMVKMNMTKFFEPLTTGENAKKFDRFAGKNATWYDTGIKILDQQGNETGKTWRLTAGQRVSLWFDINYEENLNGMLMQPGSNMCQLTVPNEQLLKKGKISEAYQEGDRVYFTIGQAKEILEEMTDYEMAWVEAFKQMEQYSKGEINEVSLKLKGYRLASVQDYFPIKRDKNFIATDFESVIVDNLLEHQGWTIARVNAHNPMLLMDVNNVVNSQINGVSDYVGYAIPIRDFQLLYNTTMEGYADSVKAAIARTQGSEVIKYIDDLMGDLQGNNRTETTWMDALRGKYAGAVLTMNPSVIIKQAASYPTAAAVLGWGSIGKAMRYFATPKSIDPSGIREKYTSAFWERQSGKLSDMEANANRNNPIKRAGHKIGNGIQAMDLLTTNVLWKAAEFYVSENTGLTPGTQEEIDSGTDAYYRAVADVYNQALEQTQPEYNVWQRPAILRSKSQIVKSVTMFKTQSFQNFGILADAVSNLSDMRENVKANPTEENQQKYQAAKAEMARAASSQIVSAVVLAVMTMLGKMLLHKMDDYKDEKGDVTPEAVSRQLGSDAISSMAGMVAGGSELFDLIKGLIEGKEPYDIEAAGISTINELYKNTYALLSGAQVLADADMTPQQKWDKFLPKGRKFAMSFAQMFGLPVNNVVNLVDGVATNAKEFVTGKPMSFEEAGFLGAARGRQTSNADVAGYIAQAMMDGNTAEAERLYNGQLAQGKTPDAINTAIANWQKANIPEIRQAAEAIESGDVNLYNALIREITQKGISTANAVKYVESERKKMQKAEEAAKAPETEQKSTGTQRMTYQQITEGMTKEASEQLYTNGMMNSLLEDGNVEQAVTVKNAMLEAGKKQSSINSSLSNYWKPILQAAYEAGDMQEVRRITEMLVSMGMNRSTIQGWTGTKSSGFGKSGFGSKSFGSGGFGKSGFGSGAFGSSGFGTTAGKKKSSRKSF